MCTVTIVPRDGLGGYRLVANRDERRSRPDGVEPAWHREGTRRVAYPLDPAGGGTWVAVSDAGLVIALLNRYPSAGAHLLAPAPSRGSIIPRLIGCRRAAEAIAFVSAFDCSRFNSFCLVAVDRREVALFTHDRHADSSQVDALSQPYLATSSSLGDDIVEAPRRQLFEQLVLSEPRDRWLLGQHRFHRTQWTGRPEISVLMERSDARTVSRTTVDVTATQVAMIYEPLPPAWAPVTRLSDTGRARAA